jgi:hypothetical protein
MKILYNGDSWCWGYSLDDRDDRYAVQLSKKLGAEYTDLSLHGGSNRRIVRTTIQHDVSQYDLGIICMTFKNRTEFYLNGKWEKVNPGRGNGKMFTDYYVNYYEEEYGHTDEMIYRQALIDHFAVNNTKLLLLTIAKDSKFQYDLFLNKPDIPLGETRHPTKVGHQIITHRIYETLIEMGKVEIQNVETEKRRPFHL